jgi:PAS domain S-box-containing protein
MSTSPGRGAGPPESSPAGSADAAELDHAGQRLLIAVESSPSAVVMVDGDGRILLVNAKTEELFGYRRDELVGESVEVLVPERFRELHPDLRRGFFRQPDVRSMGVGRDLYGRRSDGSEFPVEIGLNPIRTPEGMLVLSAIVDITARKLAEEQIRSTSAELARSNAELEQFAYAVSHDLQEPLRMVESFLQLLQKRLGDRLDDESRLYIEHAVSGSLRMRALIDGLLAYSRVHARGDERTPVDLGTSVQEALKSLQVAVQESGAQITWSDLPTVRADPVLMVQVFQNLIGNAIKFRREEAPWVRIESSSAGAFWHVSVADNGIGFEPRFADRIFGLFQRLHARDEYPGTGIGLSITKRIVEGIGGEIRVESVPGKGSTFILTLPA